MSDTFNFETRNLVDSGSNLFRSTLSLLLQQVKNLYVNSEGLGSSQVPSETRVFVEEVYSRFYNVMNSLEPGVLVNSNIRVTVWIDVAKVIHETEAIENMLASYMRTNWFDPTTRLTLMNSMKKNEEVSSWLNRLLRFEETADLALIAQKFLMKYLQIVKINIKSGTGTISWPIPEPGIKALQTGSSDTFSSLRSLIPISRSFNRVMEEVMDQFNRIHPNMSIATGNSILADKGVKQLYPDSWYRTIPDLNAGPGFVFNEFQILGINAYQLTGGAGTTFVPVYTRVMLSNDGMVISKGVRYYLNVGTQWSYNAAIPSMNITINAIGGGSSTITLPSSPVAGVLGPNFSTKILLPVSETTTGDHSNSIGYTITFAATAPIGATVVKLFHDISISVVMGETESRVDALCYLDHPTNRYQNVCCNDTWGDYYGRARDTITNDPDFNLLGYINNYSSNELSIKLLIEVLEKLNVDGSFVMRVVDEDDVMFSPLYRGTLGFTKLLSDIVDNGLSTLLSCNGVFALSLVPISRANMIKTMERIMNILHTIQSLYNFGDASVVEAVRKVLDPSL